MIRSMTGFGQALGNTDDYQVSIEMKSVNHRFLEISVKVPREYLFLEEAIKKRIGELIKRGKLDVYVNLERRIKDQKQLAVNWNLTDQYIEILNQMLERYPTLDQSPRIGDILTLPDVFQIVELELNPDELSVILLNSVESACQQLVHMRKSEGKVLQEDLTRRIEIIGQVVEEIQERAPLVSKNYRERLMQRIGELLSNSVDETRLLTEVALFSEKANIDEELTRLRSHAQQFVRIMSSDDVVGRKLDFLIQEMNREVNTIGSKANDIEISQRVVDLKAELEKMKEQVQNIE